MPDEPKDRYVNTDRYVTIQAVAEFLGWTERHVKDLVVEGSLKAVKIGSKAMRISEQSLQDFIEKNTIDPDDLFDPDQDDKESRIETPVARSKWMSKS
jgi:excisionase family DNA binding protein